MDKEFDLIRSWMYNKSVEKHPLNGGVSK